MNDTYKVCSSCAIYLTNGDDSHIDPDNLRNVEDTAKSMGLVACTYVGGWNLFVCDCCGDMNHSVAHAYENII